MKEHEIRPQNIFDEYLRLCEEDTKTFFDKVPRVEQPCPACGEKGGDAFAKNGFNYVQCPECMTLYVSPRPLQSAFEKYYTDSPSTRYWATTFYRETENARREKIWKPKAELIKKTVDKFCNISEIVDIGGGYGTFAEEIKNITGWHVVIVEPSRHLAQVCRDKGFYVIEKFMENIDRSELSERNRCFVSFELFEHLYDPAAFLSAQYRLMNTGDLFIFTTLSGLGVDIQVLWSDSKSVAPPHHLNFFNPISVKMLVRKAGLEPIEVTTPGKLDVNIIENNLSNVKDRFWKSYFKFATKQDKDDMQTFVSSHLLSSHMMVVCRK